ncbi:MAG: hypothetical protein FWH14_01295 [Oscillospiraceae bacterium]|nr:hypothetical protein [Oscillospiraceae bacterium]
MTQENTMTQRDMLKAIIEMSTTIDEAKEIIDEFAGCSTTNEKIEFLSEMFDVRIIGGCDGEELSEDEKQEISYEVIVANIIDRKWR